MALIGPAPTAAEGMTVRLSTGQAVSALVRAPAGATACYVMAHGAGAGMSHAFMEAFARGLADRGIATLRYQFPFMEAGSRRPDPPAVAHAAVRAAAAAAARRFPSLPLVAGGKSFGGRMTSQAQALAPLPGVVGLAFAGFPLHPAGKPSIARAEHLGGVRIPMLFLQGTRDGLADMGLLEGVVGALGALASLRPVEHADHAFHVPARSGRTDQQALEAMLDDFKAWANGLPHPPPSA